MGSTFDITAANQVLKQRYTKKKLNTLSYPNNPFYAMCPKDETLGSNAFVFGVRNAQPQTRSVAFASAQALGNANAGNASSYARFVVPHYNDYATANISGDAIDSAKGDENTLIDVLTGEIDGANYTATRSLAIAMYRNGGGARGQIASGQGTPTVTLADITAITNFEVGMALQVSADDGTGGGGVRAGQVFVIGVDRDLGTITVATTLGGSAANWTAGIAAAAANDFIFQLGDYNGLMPGFLGWIPTTAPTSTLFLNVDRSQDKTRLGGVRIVGNGGPIEETLISAAARLGREGSKPDVCYMNTEDYALLVKALGSKVIYERSKSFDAPDIDFESVVITGPTGPIKVVGDLNCPKGTAAMLQLKDWTLRSIGKAPKIIEEDGLMMRAVYNADAYEVRFVSRVCLTCAAPGWSANISL